MFLGGILGDVVLGSLASEMFLGDILGDVVLGSLA
jgi:hypothetical protein